MQGSFFADEIDIMLTIGQLANFFVNSHKLTWFRTMFCITLYFRDNKNTVQYLLAFRTLNHDSGIISKNVRPLCFSLPAINTYLSSR